MNCYPLNTDSTITDNTVSLQNIYSDSTRNIVHFLSVDLVLMCARRRATMYGREGVTSECDRAIFLRATVVPQGQSTWQSPTRVEQVALPCGKLDGEKIQNPVGKWANDVYKPWS